MTEWLTDRANDFDVRAEIHRQQRSQQTSEAVASDTEVMECLRERDISYLQS